MSYLTGYTSIGIPPLGRGSLTRLFSPPDQRRDAYDCGNRNCRSPCGLRFARHVLEQVSSDLLREIRSPRICGGERDRSSIPHGDCIHARGRKRTRHASYQWSVSNSGPRWGKQRWWVGLGLAATNEEGALVLPVRGLRLFAKPIMSFHWNGSCFSKTHIC